MFHTSSQKTHWMFPSPAELDQLRQEANRSFIQRHNKSVSSHKVYNHFLTPEEEKHLLTHYQYVLREFCRSFQPPMPKSVVGTAFQYYKRFYLFNSVMDYHPKFILVTCIYLACKVDEFNVSMDQFIANVKGDREKARDGILNHELLLMQQLRFHLTVHNPFRAIEGLFIDIKTRCGDLSDPESCRSAIDAILDKTFLTDACLLLSPSQIALAAISFAFAEVAGGTDVDKLDHYIKSMLVEEDPEHSRLIDDMQEKLWAMIKGIPDQPDKAKIRTIEKKLEGCRNQANNPESKGYKEALIRKLNMEEDEFGVPASTTQATSSKHIKREMKREMKTEFKTEPM